MVRVGRTKGAGFIGDHFRAGATGEIWIIDTIRTWAVSDASTRLGDVFERVTLFGGIETAPPQPGEPPQPECDCHNLTPIKSAWFEVGSNQLEGADVRIGPAAGGVRQVDFRHLHWSVPGGAEIQFGVMGTARRGKEIWYTRATALDEPHSLKIFDAKGKLEGPYAIEDRRIVLNVQVWGHRSAPVTIRSAAETIEVVLRSDDSFDAAKADRATLRFGPKYAAPVESHPEKIDGRALIAARFRRADTGLQTSDVNACLTGRQLDGTPFEGCALLPRRLP